MNISKREIYEFQETVWGYYREHARGDLPWRQPEADGSFDAYKILVSEVMLQQTQVTRVTPKYQEFLVRFPAVKVLAEAELAEVLLLWSGLGYNRRAKFLRQSARMVQKEYGGIVPDSPEELVRLPGIGLNTANAVITYAYDKPLAFVETNIRTVLIHHFFEADKVTDAEILNVAELVLDAENPREWHWALMDYGTHLKSMHGNAARRSRHYVRQSAFEGSRRQLRGKILRLLGEGSLSRNELRGCISDGRLDDVLETLLKEEMVKKSDSRYSL